ncbi:MAG: hypothetical protein V7608_3140 [Hyphomicrobiales bacterium]|jgi:hypothetical protein
MTDEEFDRLWNDYVSSIKTKVRARASAIAEADDGRKDILISDAIDAMREYIPGKPVASTPSAPEPHQGWINKNVTGFIGITGGLAIIFGILGILPVLFKNEITGALGTMTTGFLEIAKLCAGALVGGAAGAAAASAPRK